MSNRLSFRIAALVTAALCIVAAMEAWLIGIAGGSIVPQAAAIAAVTAGVWLGLSAFVPALVTWPLRKLGLAGLWNRIEGCESRSAGCPGGGRFTALAVTMLVSGAICFSANVFSNALTPPPVHLDDQGAYLERADRMQRAEGPLYTVLSVMSDLRSGRFREDNRHPLFLTLLAWRPDERWGRTLAWTFGVAAFVTGVWMVFRRFSLLTAGIFAMLLGMNFNLGQFSVMVVCETLLIWLVSLAYFVLLPAPTASRSLGRRRWRILVASTLLGLSFLTKGTGLVFFGVFLAWLAWQCRPRGGDDIPQEVEDNGVISLVEAYPFRQWVVAMICGVMGFLAVSEPLLERNLRAFGNPFHNVNSLLLFADSYGEFDNLVQGGVTTGEAAESFFKRHSFGDLIDRELRGLVWEAFIMLRMLGPQGLDDGRVIFGLPIAISCGIGLWFERRPAKWLLLGWVFVAWVLFAWYVPIAAGDRFPIPLLLPVLAHAAEGMRRILIASQISSPLAVDVSA
ncbi:hypothetical protein Pan44_20130 [Caulifigura coniformis]|uniref:Glycosyltransferase RgtA/B/C/D-like domain-containing protein n=1 Tax=Caulifigura coniformis TaxID=2527983 RepID=A0A517SCZ7_9PLAN|nr:hypothetical protein [Caulifigura coniformis]QDT53986.1 hypothetical protein Pan44_20130 [Caulifigura coniformis]